MRLVDLISQETSTEPPNIMLLRHFLAIDKLLVYGGTVEEFTALQPTGSAYDFRATGRPKAEVVVVIVHDRVYAVYRVLGIEAEGNLFSLASEPHHRFDAEREIDDKPARLFNLSQIPSSAVGLEATGWKGRTSVARNSGSLFWKIEIHSPNETLLTEEVADHQALYEGAVRQVMVNAYERNATARRQCIAHHGSACVICGFDFGAVYGPLAKGFIHVHHLRPLSDIGEEYEVDEIADLRPVCANCHSVIHLGGGCRTVEDVKMLLNAAATTS